jgi:thiamine pyrophosphokinase
MNVVIVANGELENHPRVRALWRDADLRIAADGGANNARAFLERAPDIVIGDLDSIDDATRAFCARSEFIMHPREKDATDLELARDLALARGATAITLLAALGGRFDQMLANILLIAQTPRARVRIAGADFDAWLARDSASIAGAIGDTVSLIPLSERVEAITTRGLKYPLRAETLAFGSTRGVSNALVAPRAEIILARGVLLVAHLFART